jgi:dTDP-4-dehydrorhamnose reductase
MTGWLVTGAGGQLGRELCDLLVAEGEDVTGLTRDGLDITDADAIRSALRGRPPVVVNCAAWTNVDLAEEQPGAAFRVNGEAVYGLARACAEYGATLVQVSTDYVFGGQAARPYGEGDRPAPATEYGRGKLAGERAVRDLLPGSGYVVRTAWLYGKHGANFVNTMIGLERRKPAVDVVDDQRGQPTWAADVAGQIVALVRSGADPGVYHATSSGSATWFELAREIFRRLDADPSRVRPVTSAAFKRPAPRPAYSVLGHGAWHAAGLPPIGPWEDGLRRAFASLL